MATKISFRADTTSGAYAWKQMQAWREKSRQNREQFESNMSALTDTLTSAMQSQTEGLGQIAVQRATDRINAANAAKQDEALKALQDIGVDTSA